jgi:hypothetical protein
MYLETIQIFFLFGLLVAAVLVFLWHKHAFILWLRRGTPRRLKGKVTAAFLDEVTTVCREGGVRWGWLGGVRRGKRVVLVFSWHFPSDVRQRLRNLWAIHA